MRTLLAAVATIALASTPALAQPGKGNGNGNGNGNGAQAAKADRGPPARMERGNDNRGNGNGNGNARMAPQRAQNAAPAQRANNGNGNGNRDIVREARRNNGNDAVRDVRRDASRVINRTGIEDRYDDIRVIRDTGDRFGYRTTGNRGLIDGCPPGLAKKYNGCQPPGQVRTTFRDYRPDYFGYSSIRDGRYYYDDGYLVRLGNNNSIASFLPLLGGALSIGNVWPTSYSAQRVPDYYVDYYGLGSRDRYRYADDVIYRVDPETAAITSIAALLTGDEFVVGQPMPRGYDVYNVPYSYRDRYYDTPQAQYRYSDGYVYEVDPETRLIAAAIELLV